MLKFLSNRKNKSEEKMPITSKRLAGPGYIILNVIRVFNVITLLAVIAASIVMVVKTFTVSKFFFFDAATHIISAISSMFLVLSESSFFKDFFARNWPILSPSHGFNFLGFAMIVLGNNMLGNLNKEATSQKSLGLPFWRLVIGSGIVVFIFGFVNIIANYVFRDAKLGVTARQVRAKGAVAISDREVVLDIESEKHHSPSIVSSFPAGSSIYSSPAPRKSPVKAFFRSARDSILPSYHSRAPYPTAGAYPAATYPTSPIKSPTKTEAESPRSPQMNISAPLNINPQFAHLIKPQTAHHPSNRRPDGSF
ncbi:hypothetical protein BT63DRAFT_211671 [Microthyrium microscopicum]|uniref:DUF7598 domain-containing protein n=1 Tax=Microthyrium microscopicum TaxID=703497 RepID=A0A6A6UK51_9PEZI|nr:hypothetical protein BT63DRAFT_211671 [Microthyrium microscopicum]